MKKVDLSKYTMLFKTKKALESLEDRELIEEILREYGPKTGKPITKRTRRDIADRVFSVYVRITRADKKGYVKCITCNIKDHWTKLQNGHFITRGTIKYRFDINNCYPQCYKCNCILSGNYIIYTISMIKIHGKTKVEKMINDNEIISIKQYDYEIMIKKRYKEIKEKEKQLDSKQTKKYDDMEF